MKPFLHSFKYIMTPCLLCCLTAMSVKGQNVDVEEYNIRYPRPLSNNDQRVAYPIKLLELAISKQTTLYHLRPDTTPMPQARALKTLFKQDGIDIVWTMTSIDRELQFLPIRVPIYKGLIGWRLFLINPHNQHKFNAIVNLAGLRKLIVGQGHDWPDTRILTENGFSVLSTPNYESLFEMLKKDRFDFLPRSIVEIWGELDSRLDLHFQVEKKLLLRYPAAMYFFVNRNNPKLAKDIESGLLLAIEDGSFDRLFFEENENMIKKAHISERIIIDIPNPLMSENTPLKRTEFWYKPPS